jgi:alpha-methylacyl-CoA racemase
MKPLQGVRVLEFEGIGPCPLVGRILMGMGAQVTLIARPSPTQLAKAFGSFGLDGLEHEKRKIIADLKDYSQRDLILDLVAQSDVLIEGNRPGVMEKLGLGPADCVAHNQRLVYGRMTGWGQTGSLAQSAGHELNYLALSGALLLGNKYGEPASAPATLLGDAPGALGLAYGIACALFQREVTGKGCVIDAAVTDIVVMIGQLAHYAISAGHMGGPQSSVFHDSHFYDTYVCSDGKFISIAAIEPQFYQLLLSKLELNDLDSSNQFNSDSWPEQKQKIAQIIGLKTRGEWCELLEGTDTCFAPVLSLDEAALHPHNKQREAFVKSEHGYFFGAAAPKFSEY